MTPEWDQKALETATAISLMWGEDRSNFVSKIQVAVLDAMRWSQQSALGAALVAIDDTATFADADVYDDAAAAVRGLMYAKQDTQAG